jgi:hypothetical protein
VFWFFGHYIVTKNIYFGDDGGAGGINIPYFSGVEGDDGGAFGAIIVI